MSATITLRLNDQASKGLGEVQHSAEATKAEFEQLSEAQKQHIEVIHKHQGSMLDFAGNGVVALAHLSAAWLKYHESMIWLKFYNGILQGPIYATKLLADQTHRVATSSIHALRVVPSLGPVVSRITPIVTLGTAAWAAYAAVLDRTGKKVVDTVEDFSNATEEQIQAFNELAQESTRTGEAIDEIMARAGKTWEDFGVRIVPVVETNLDRVHEAAASLGPALIEPFQEGAAAARDLYNSMELTIDVFGWIDRAATKQTDNFVANVGAMKSAWRSFVDQQRASVAEDLGGNAKEYLEEVKALRELSAWHEKMDRQREEERDDFARLRKINADLESDRQQAESRKRLDAMKTLSEIDAEIQRQREKAGQMAAARQFDRQSAEQHAAAMADLERRRTVIAEAEERRRLAIAEAGRKFRQDMEERSLREQARLRDDYLRESREAYERHQEIMTQREQAIRDFRFALHREVVNDAIAALEREGADAETIHAAKLQQIEQERNQRLAATDDQLEKERILFEAEQRLLQEESAFRREQLRKQVDDERRAAEEKLRIRKELHDRLRGQLEGQGVTGESILQQQDQRKVLEMLQARRRAAAENAFRNSEEGQRMSAEANTGSQANARFKARLRAVNRQADIDAFRDARSGNLNPGELQQAQADAARQQLQAMQQNGKLSSDVVQVLTQQAQAAAQQQATIDILQQQVEALGQQARGQQRAAAGTRQRAQRGSLGQ